MLDKSQLLMLLIEKWEKIARRAFFDSQNEKDPTGKRTIETKAIAYANCARELRMAIQISPEPFSSTTQEAGRM